MSMVLNHGNTQDIRKCSIEIMPKGLKITYTNKSG